MASVAYGNVHDLADRLGFPLNDAREAVLFQVAEDASRWIDKQTARRFYPVTETRYYSVRWHYGSLYGGGSGFGQFPWGNPERVSGGGYADQRVMIDDCLSVSVVATDGDGDGVYEQPWTVGTDYFLGPRNGPARGEPYRSINRNLATGRYMFSPWEDGLSVTGSFGYSATVPAPIHQLWMDVAMLMARPVMEMSIPGVQDYKLGGDLSVTMQPQDLPPASKAILEQYRDPLFGGL